MEVGRRGYGWMDLERARERERERELGGREWGMEREREGSDRHRLGGRERESLCKLAGETRETYYTQLL